MQQLEQFGWGDSLAKQTGQLLIRFRLKRLLSPPFNSVINEIKALLFHRMMQTHFKFRVGVAADGLVVIASEIRRRGQLKPPLLLKTWYFDLILINDGCLNQT